MKQDTISIIDEDGTVYEFEKPEFECEFWKTIGNTLYGIVYEDGRDVAQQWDIRDGESFEFIRIGDIKFNLTPVKKQWYEDDNNFPCLIRKEGTKS